ncbi:hypothetical protein HELRODRAFT_190743 [Helobdella robusta]|uniref:b(0,+)-type amino acid transporter 1 n=1 Tax=Helobdella robusta TaxID=6412 RepID=T1FS91_HELRO|nr:hypothetical protein HELRODRAFT_190743 [Helobdella robusta]ESO08465.1 hypothetical protein HELRODRAFT_190743 [Helobdella robusta]
MTENEKSRELEGSDEVVVETKNEIPRTIGLIGGISFIIGTIIGSGIFVSPRGVAFNSGSIGMTIMNWLICGVISLLGALCYAELGTIITKSGADYVYLEEAYGPWISFQYSWITNFMLKPGAQATFSLTFAQYVMTPFFDDGCGEAPNIIKRLLALAVIFTLAAINSYSVRLAGKIQIIFTGAKLFALIIIIIGGIVRLFQGETQYLSTGFNGTENKIGKLATGFYSGMWAYDGWNTANFMTEEIINPSRNLPLSICIGVPITVIIYILTNISYFTVMDVEGMINSPAVALTWAEEVIPSVAWLIPIFVALSCFGTGNGSLFSGGRLMYAAARNHHLPDILGMVHVHKYTPIPAVVVIVLLAFIFVFISNISAMIDFLSFTLWIFYALNFLGVILLKFSPKYKNVYRPINIPLIFPLFTFLFAVFLVLVPLITTPQLGYFFVLLFIIIGYIVFIPFVFFKIKCPGIGKITMFFQLLMQVFIPDLSLE